MTRPFDFLDFKKYSLYELTDSKYFRDDGKPKEVIDTVYGKIRGKLKYSCNLVRYEFDNGWDVQLTNNAFSVKLYGKNIIEYNNYYGIVSTKTPSFEFLINSDGGIEEKTYHLKNKSIRHYPLSGAVGVDYRYSRLDIRADNESKVSMLSLMNDRIIIIETQDASGTVSELEITYHLPVQKDKKMVLELVNGKVHFTLMWFTGLIIESAFLENITEISPEYLWNDEIMFQVIVAGSDEFIEEFDKFKNDFEHILKTQIEASSNHLYAKNLLKLVEEQKKL